MLFGAAYYPEHWTKNRMEIDAKMMADAKFNVVRMGEFAWSKMEPSEGEFNFEWLTEAIELFSSYGIKTILGTPTATPPKWLMDKHPEIYAVDINGKSFKFGARRHYCHSSSIYRKYIEIIVREMAERYATNDNVIAWQVDNELAGDHNGRCYCNSCTNGFREYLSNKFAHIKALNNAWGTIVWSQGYKSFKEVDLPSNTHAISNPSLHVEYYRFASQSMIDYQNFQIAILKEYTTNQPITTNVFDLTGQIDHHELIKTNDFISSDFYPNLTFEKPEPYRQALAVDIFIGSRDKMMIKMEQQSGMPGGDIMFPPPKKGDLARWAYQSIAHGCDGIVFFRWRTNIHGAEQHWHGILGHDGRENRIYSETRKMGSELESISQYIENTKNVSNVAIVLDYQLNWVFEVQPHIYQYDYMQHIEEYYKALYDLGISVDIVSKDAELSKYSVLILPNHSIVNDKYAKLYEEYVQSGGNVVFDFRSGVRDDNNALYEITPPGKLKNLLGIEIREYGVIGKYEDTAISFENGDTGACKDWFEEITLLGAESVAEYIGDVSEGKSAISRNKLGEGNAWYIGTILENETLKNLLSKVIENANVNLPSIKRTKDVEVATRYGENSNVVFMINHSSIEQTVPIGNYELYDIINNKKIKKECRLDSKEVGIFKQT